MRIQHRALLFSVLAVSACTQVAAPDPDLARLKGQPIQPVIAKFGAPASEQKVDGGTSYAWTMDSRVEMPERRTVTDYSTGRANQIETTVMVAKMQSCTLRLRADGGGLVTAVEQDGPYQACGAFADRLKGGR